VAAQKPSASEIEWEPEGGGLVAPHSLQSGTRLARKSTIGISLKKRQNSELTLYSGLTLAGLNLALGRGPDFRV
jgi:hypothetical protein